jgi:hypothetical protein
MSLLCGKRAGRVPLLSWLRRGMTEYGALRWSEQHRCEQPDERVPVAVTSRSRRLMSSAWARRNRER